MKIVVDSCTDLDDMLLDEIKPEVVPFKITIEGVEYVDDRNLNVDDFRHAMIASDEVPMSACPSPYDYQEHFEDESEKEVLALTISSKLSGSYNSAIVAKQTVEEKTDAKIHVFDSTVAASGETLIALKLREEVDSGKSFSEVVNSVENYIKNIQIYFICGSLNNLIKNGRIPSWKAKLVELLNIVPVMKGEDCSIDLYKKIRGSNKAYKELVQVVKEQAEKYSRNVLTITHVDNEKRAIKIKSELEVSGIFKRIVVVKARGLTTLYGDDKGIILSF